MDTDYWGQYSSDRPWVNMLALIILVSLISSVRSRCDKIHPLGLQSGDIRDSQISASSVFTSSVGPENARLETNTGGGAWCPAGLVSIHSDTQEWIQIHLEEKVMVTGVSVQGRWAGGVGQEWTPELSVAWYDTDRDLYVQTNDVYTANTDTYSVVRINLTNPIITNIIRIIPVSQHPRAVCLRLELHGCEIDSEHDMGNIIEDIKTDTTDTEILSDNDQIMDDDRKEIREETVTVTDQKLFPLLLIVLATVSTILIILSAILLRKISKSRKQILVPAHNDVQYFQNSLPNNYHHQHQPPQPPLKKNIYEVPKVEPIYSTPIEIFYPSSPSNISTDSSECETFKTKTGDIRSAATSTPRHQTLSSFDACKSPKMQKIEDLVTFSPIYSYFSSTVEPKYSNIV